MQYEVEIKCLVKDAEQAEHIPEAIRRLGYGLERKAEYNQLNDYYIDGDIAKLADKLQGVIDEAQRKVLLDIIAEHDTFSVRARQNNDTVLFIVKAATGTSANHASQRAELETPVKLSLDELKDVITGCGYAVQARWMAHRVLYRVSNGIVFDSIFSPGYGYQAEFELLVDASDKANAETRVRDFARELGQEPVDPERVARMFDYYNQHWQEYYGTQKTFHID